MPRRVYVQFLNWVRFSQQQQQQKMDVPACAKTAHYDLDTSLCWIVPHVNLTTHSVKGLTAIAQMYDNATKNHCCVSPIDYIFVYEGSCEDDEHHHHLSLNREGRWGTTDDFATSFLHFSLFSTVLWDLPNSRPVHSLMLFFHLFLCLPCLLPPFTVPCKMVFARPDEPETWPYHCSLRLFTIVRRSSCGSIACWIFLVDKMVCVWDV